MAGGSGPGNIADHDTGTRVLLSVWLESEDRNMHSSKPQMLHPLPICAHIGMDWIVVWLGQMLRWDELEENRSTAGVVNVPGYQPHSRGHRCEKPRPRGHRHGEKSRR